jgi:hypothetical protein
MSDSAEEAFILRGFLPRKVFAAKIGRCDRTVKRLQDAGKIVVTYLGNQPLVDVEKSLARMRGEDKRRGRAVG